DGRRLRAPRARRAGGDRAHGVGRSDRADRARVRIRESESLHPRVPAGDGNHARAIPPRATLLNRGPKSERRTRPAGTACAITRCMFRLLVLVFLALPLSADLFAASALLRYPDIRADRIIFSW